MRDKWYADKRDLVKWGGMLHLCKIKQIKYILQVAYYRETKFPMIEFDGTNIPISKEVLKHFRDIEAVFHLGKQSDIEIVIFKMEFNHNTREEYGSEVCGKIGRMDYKKIVFLDPDTGLAPVRCDSTHVKADEVAAIWNSMGQKDILVFYQHRFWDSDWKFIRRKQLAKSIGVELEKVRLWHAKDIADDVVFYFVEKVSN
jgi:hypothetical protein